MTSRLGLSISTASYFAATDVLIVIRVASRSVITVTSVSRANPRLFVCPDAVMGPTVSRNRHQLAHARRVSLWLIIHSSAVAIRRGFCTGQASSPQSAAYRAKFHTDEARILPHPPSGATPPRGGCQN